MVPMYKAQLPSNWTYILNNSSTKVVFSTTEDIFYHVQMQVLKNIPLVQSSLCLNAKLGEVHAF